jgi:hypothetical protein
MSDVATVYWYKVNNGTERPCIIEATGCGMFWANSSKHMGLGTTPEQAISKMLESSSGGAKFEITSRGVVVDLKEIAEKT